MPYAKTSLRKEKRELREKMRAMGLDYRDIAAEFGRRFRLRPRAAWREAYGWSLQETADRINEFRGDIGLDPGGFAGMTASHLCEYENWPGHGPELSGRRPTPYLLALLAAVYSCGATDLIDLADREHLLPAAARRGDSHEAYTALKAAAAYADEAGDDRVELGAMFGPTNVIIHRVAVPVELGRPAEAVRNIPAAGIAIPPQLAERRARFLIDVARSFAQTGDDRAAEDAIVQAEAVAPDEVRHHRLTRQLVRDLLPRTSSSSSVRALASRCQLPT